jgi:predicted TIM-barrel fold metal-dependent hydrolase
MPVKVKDVDKTYYDEHLANFIPRRVIDVHTHVWLASFMKETSEESRSVKWPSLVAKDNPIEDLLRTYQLMLPRQQVTPLVFSLPDRHIDLGRSNGYVSQVAREHDLPSLIVSVPEWSAEELERRVRDGGFLGLKPYLDFAPAHIATADITIFDFLPHHHLEAADAHGWIVMLHIPRPGRLKDPVNLAQLLEIERRYPDVHLVVPHIGRAYCVTDIGDGFDVLRDTERMIFDFSASTNAQVFERFLRAFGPGRVMFGSDLPILRMRMRRICENDTYINMVPPGLYGDLSGDPHMREVSEEEGRKLSFFLYEELLAFRRAAEAVGLNDADLEDVFFNNARRLIESAGGSIRFR